MPQPTPTRILAFPLLEACLRAGPAANVACSPAGIATALMMVMSGARGATRDGIARALDLEALDGAAAKELAASLHRELTPAALGVELRIANALWRDPSIRFAEPFLHALTEDYGAANGDLSDPCALEQINTWVARETRGKIPSMLDHIDPAAMLVLLNAIYFKGAWADPFEERRTRDLEFTRADGRRIRHPTMRDERSCAYHETETFQVARLRYVGDRLAMNVFLPRRHDGLPALVEELAQADIVRLPFGMSIEELDLALPRFELTWRAALDGPLAALGAADAFDPARADFAPMIAGATPVPVFISRVLHEAYVQVNEAGTEAAAATAMDVDLGIPDPCELIPFVVDRPFAFLIRDGRTSVDLFVGAVNDPSSP